MEISEEKNELLLIGDFRDGVDVNTHSGPPRASFKRSIFAECYD